MRQRTKIAPGPEMVGRPTLQKRGWTAALITRFLGEPDALAPNPHYKCAPPRKLYLATRVDRIEKGKAFRAARGRAEARKAAAARANATKLAKLDRYIDELRVDVEVMPESVLTERAVVHYQVRQNMRQDLDEWTNRFASGGFESSFATPRRTPAFLDRIIVNYLRHRCTRYEEELLRLHGRAGAARGAMAIKKKVLEAIAAAYPYLALECRRQAEKMGDLRSDAAAGS